MSKKLIITIARQYGSGGREIGEKIAEMLSLPLYDKELITEAAKTGDMHMDTARKVDEVAANSLLYTLAMGSNVFGSAMSFGYKMPINDKLFYLQSDIIRELAEKEDCVFVGRCADYVLRDHPTTLRVFVYANDECRIGRIMERQGLSRNKAEDMMNKIDHRRATYYNFYTGQKWGKYDNYALAVNSSLLGIEDTAKMIADFALTVKNRMNAEE